MKSIEDEDVRLKFVQAVEELPAVCNLNDIQTLYEHFFQAGRESMAKELCTVKPKRTIAEYHRMDDSFFVISNDRKMFHWQGNRFGWYALPDLPQD